MLKNNNNNNWRIESYPLNQLRLCSVYNEWEKVISDIKNQSSIIDYLISKLFYSFLNILFSVIKNST